MRWRRRAPACAAPGRPGPSQSRRAPGRPPWRVGVPSASILRSKARPATAGGANESATTLARRASNDVELVGDLVSQADQKRERGPAVKRDLEALARLGVELLPLHTRQERNERDVGGARDGEELGRPLDEPEQSGALVGNAKGGGGAAHAAVSAGAGGGPPPRRLIRK